MEQPGKHRLAGRLGVDREARELAELVPGAAQAGEFLGVQPVGRQAIGRIQPDADRPDHPALVVGEKRRQVGVRLGRRRGGRLVSAPVIALVDHPPGFLVPRSLPGDPDLEAFLAAGKVTEGRQFGLGDRQVAKAQRRLVVDGLPTDAARVLQRHVRRAGLPRRDQRRPGAAQAGQQAAETCFQG